MRPAGDDLLHAAARAGGLRAGWPRQSPSARRRPGPPGRALLAGGAAAAGGGGRVSVVRRSADGPVPQYRGEAPQHQAEQLAVRAVEDFDGFYAARRAAPGEPTSEGSVVVVSFDSKVLLLDRDDLREARGRRPRGAGGAGSRSLGSRASSRGEKKHSKPMATVAAVCTTAPFVRSAEDFLESLMPRFAGKQAAGRATPSGCEAASARTSNVSRGRWWLRRRWKRSATTPRTSSAGSCSSTAPRRSSTSWKGRRGVRRGRHGDPRHPPHSRVGLEGRPCVPSGGEPESDCWACTRVRSILDGKATMCPMDREGNYLKTLTVRPTEWYTCGRESLGCPTAGENAANWAHSATAPYRVAHVRHFNIEVGHCSQCRFSCSSSRPPANLRCAGPSERAVRIASCAANAHAVGRAFGTTVRALAADAIWNHGNVGGVARVLHRTARRVAPIYVALCRLPVFWQRCPSASLGSRSEARGNMVMNYSASYELLRSRASERLRGPFHGRIERPRSTVVRPALSGSFSDLPELLDALSKDPSHLRRLAALSSHHENGFLKIVLMDLPDLRLRLRLHFWQRARIEGPQPANNIHNHRFSFYSLLLFGHLRQHTWSVGATGLRYSHYLYYPLDGSMTHALQYVGKASLQATEKTTLTSGSCYFFPSDVLHTSECFTDTAATLFLEDRTSLRPHADVFSLKYPSHSAAVHARPIRPDEYVLVLAAVIESAIKVRAERQPTGTRGARCV